MRNELIRIGQIGTRFSLDAADTNGSVAMFEKLKAVMAKHGLEPAMPPAR